MADLYGMREIVTSRFYERHVVQVRVADSGGLSERELDDVTKKLAENLYQSRDVSISTVVVLGWREANMLKSEIANKQLEFQQDPSKMFTTDALFPQYARGTKDGPPAQRQRATSLGLRRFRYKVISVQGEHGPPFKIDHYDGVI